MQSDEQQHAGRHRWGGEKSALAILAGLVGLIVLIGLALFIFSGGDESPPSDSAAESADSAGSPPIADGPSGESSKSKSKSPSPKPSKSKKKSKKYTSGDNPHGAAKVCGDGFKPVEKLTVTSDGTTLGTVHLLYDNDSGTNCVVTLKAVDIGEKTRIDATLTVKGGTSASESGKFDYYAGPVKREAPATCVKFGGAVDDVAVDSGDWAHCD